MYFNYQTAIAYYEARVGLVYRVPSFQEWLAWTNAANAITFNVNEIDPTGKNLTISENSGDVQKTKSRIK